MSVEKERKMKMGEVFSVSKRGFLLIAKHCPTLIVSSTLMPIFVGVKPYVEIFLSARIISELAGKRRSEALLRWTLIAVLVTAILNLAATYLKRWNKKNSAVFFPYGKEKIYIDKKLEMDFVSLDDAHTNALYDDMRQSEQWRGWNFNCLIHSYREILCGFVGILSAIALTIGLFTTQIPESNIKFKFLNHPIFVVLLIGIIVGLTLFSPVLDNKAEAMWHKYAEQAKLGNRIFCFYGFAAKRDRYRAMDIRMYEQEKVFGHYFLADHSFGLQSEYARIMQGIGGFYAAISAGLSVILVGMIYIYVCVKSWAGAFGVGMVTQYIGALTILTDSISNLVAYYGELRENAYYLQKVYEFLDIPNDMYQGSLTTEKRSDRNYEVEFRDVSFRYPNMDTYALKHVSMKFKIGERLAVVGMNGSGKTTFIKLLCRLYDPTEGEILLNGINIKKYNDRDYRDIFSVVFQDFQLLSFSLAENVAVGLEYDGEKVKDCLKKASFSDTFFAEKDGIETMLYRDFDPKGVEISGGEAQKIAIARALYKDAPFMILDEPTAALDPVAEAEIYGKFNEIATDKTCVYISHRLSSCRFCDEILVFDQGQVIEQGTHEELVSDQGSKYYELWNAQAKYYI